MSMFSAHVELARQRITEDQASALVDHLEQFHGAVGVSPAGHVDAQISVEASTIGQAATIAALVMQDAATAAGMHSGTDAIVVEVMTEDEFIRRQDTPDVGPSIVDRQLLAASILGSEDAAELLGVSRQRLMQYVDDGRLGTVPVGRTHGFVRAEVEQLARKRSA